MTSNPMITKDFLRKLHLYCYDDVQDYLDINRMLDEEMKKPEAEMDAALVEECFNYFDVILGEDPVIDEETLDAKYKEVLARAEQKQPAQPAKVIKSKKHSVRKFFFILAATITVLFATLTIAAKICGYDNAWEFVYQKAIELKLFDSGEIINGNGITLIGSDEPKTFATFEEFLESESLDVLYPQSLPNDLKPKTISKYAVPDGRCSYTIQFNDNRTSIIIRNYYSVDSEDLAGADMCFVNELMFYVYKNENGTYQALCNDDVYEYAISTSDYDTLMIILQNMKGSSL